MDLEKVRGTIRADFDDHIERIRRLIRQPSISSEDRGILEMATLVRDELEALGSRPAEIVPTERHPVVTGRLDVGAKHTVLVYLMYDTQPFEGETWSSPPLAADLVERPPWGRIVVGRGAINTKGPMGAFFNALHAAKDAGQKLPVNLLFVAEGEEELGSPHLPAFVKDRVEDLKAADTVFYPTASQDVKGHVTVSLGNKGIVYLELECTGKDWGRGPSAFDIHSSNKAWIDSPTWRLVQALATMVSPDGNRILVAGLDSHVRPPNEEEAALVRDLAKVFDPDTIRTQAKVERFIDDAAGEPLLRKYFFSTTLNIDGLLSGYTGPGSKTVLPWRALAKVDIRLVPEQAPDEVIEAVRTHLTHHGFGDLRVHVLDRYPASQTSLQAPIVQAVRETYASLGVPYEVWPRMGGSLPMFVFTGPPLSLPAGRGGLGHGTHAHAPDEYMVIDGDARVRGLLDQEASYLAILDRYAAKAL